MMLFTQIFHFVRIFPDLDLYLSFVIFNSGAL